MKTKHTQGKLTLAPEPSVTSTVNLLDSDGLIVAACPRYGAGLVSGGQIAPWHLAEANAQRLALAWNCHDELVEALEALTNWATDPAIAEWLNRSGAIGNYGKFVLDARAILAKVKGG